MNDTEFINQTRETLDQCAEALDAETSIRLHTARLKALDQHANRPQPLFDRRWAGAGLALVSLLLLFFVGGLFQQTTMSPLEDIELLTTEADLDLVLEYDLYEWLEQSELVDTRNGS